MPSPSHPSRPRNTEDKLFAACLNLCTEGVRNLRITTRAIRTGNVLSGDVPPSPSPSSCLPVVELVAVHAYFNNNNTELPAPSTNITSLSTPEPTVKSKQTPELTLPSPPPSPHRSSAPETLGSYCCRSDHLHLLSNLKQSR